MKRIASFLRLIDVSRTAKLGAAFVTTGILAELMLVIGELFFFESHPYIGIVTYVMLPGLITLGLVLMPLGIIVRLRRAHSGFSLAAIESLATGRGISVGHTLQVVTTLSLLNIVIFALVGYRGFHYTESVEFCGTVCHEVMHPEFDAYSRSPHSQISCVECHIGSGADWYVKSKLSGARQLFAVVANNYSKPIETPVHNLRPARDVCEVCHRPELFHGNLVRVLENFESDEHNSRTFTVLNMRVGGGDEEGRQAQGIHWHVSKKQQVRYYATDRKRENIVWVEQLDEDGTRRVWTNPDAPVEPPADADLRVMDCVDCHNRTAHPFLSPDQALDEWMATGRIDPAVPWIRKVAHEVIAPPFETSDEATAAIGRLPDVYRERFPEHWDQHEEQVRATVAPLQNIHAMFVHPDMKIQWNTYNSLIGHATPHTQACFRCHNGILRDGQGEPITVDCKACHFILANREADPRILDRLERR